MQSQLRHKIGAHKLFILQYYYVISNFVSFWRTIVGNFIYSALRLCLVYRDIRIYNIKDVTLIKAVYNYPKLPKNSYTEKRLLNWKQKADEGTKVSTFCVDEIKKRWSEPIEG